MSALGGLGLAGGGRLLEEFRSRAFTNLTFPANLIGLMVKVLFATGTDHRDES